MAYRPVGRGRVGAVGSPGAAEAGAKAVAGAGPDAEAVSYTHL
ncbi:hypothetical protein [Streptomyces sp. rh207]